MALKWSGVAFPVFVFRRAFVALYRVYNTKSNAQACFMNSGMRKSFELFQGLVYHVCVIYVDECPIWYQYILSYLSSSI